MSQDLKSRNPKFVGLTRFWGGQKRGSCVQVTVARNLGDPVPADKFFDSVTLSKQEAVALAQDLLDFASGTEVDEFDAPVLECQTDFTPADKPRGN